jgi:hypothetical protein
VSAEQTRIALSSVAARLSEDGGLLAEALIAGDAVNPGPDDPALGALAAAGPLSAGREAQIAVVVEAVYEGFLLHGGSSRILNASDGDLNILAGDRLYALGLAELAALGDLDSVRELADVIAICAQARALDDRALAIAAWQLGASAIGWGSSPEAEQAKDAVSDDASAAARALQAAACQLRGDVAQSD